MSVYVSIRGWLECDREQLNAVKAIVESHAGHHYSGGWGFPGRHFNWTYYAFNGGNLQEADVPWLFGQFVAIAELPASDEDGDRVEGSWPLMR